MDAPQENQPIFIARVWLEDGTYADAVLTTPWEGFVNQLVTHACVITGDMFVNRSSITKVVRMRVDPAVDITGVANVVAFPDPQGSA